MEPHDHDDQQISEIFRQARKDEQASIPTFEEVMEHEPTDAKRSWFAKLWTGPGLRYAMGSVAMVLIAVWAAGVFQDRFEGQEAPNGGTMEPVKVVRKYTPPTKPELETAPMPGENTAAADAAPEQEKAPAPKSIQREPARTLNERKSVPAPAPVPTTIPTPVEPEALRSTSPIGKNSVVEKKQMKDARAEVPVTASGGIAQLSAPGAEKLPTVFTEAYVQDTPSSGRYYQRTITLEPRAQDEDKGSARSAPVRSREFKTVVGGPVVFAPPERRESDSEFNTEEYAPIQENGFQTSLDHPLSTFSIDVDTASYANVRRFLNQGQTPPPDAVRIEELLNYFPYNDPAPSGGAPFSVNVEIADAPWNPTHRLARIGLKGREIRRGELEGSNLVFLLDVSGSMVSPNKLPLLKKAMGLLIDQLGGRDTVSIVVYAGASGLVLPPTSGNDKPALREALERLDAGGGTNGGAGLALAYSTAKRCFLRGGVNRVILATDGDFNLGTTGKGQLLDMIEKYAKEDNISLTALGFGMGNYKDGMLEHLADKANGNYAYIDSLKEARKVLVEQVGGTLVTIAKDVKIQVEFNPAQVAAYRLIGYENRMLAKEDFNDDTKDAGEIGAGHSVTALYELVPAGLTDDPVLRGTPGVDPLKYQPEAKPVRRKDRRDETATAATRSESFTVKLRYKEPTGKTSRKIEVPATDTGLGLNTASDDFRFAAAVAAFGMKLRRSEYVGEYGWEQVRSLAAGAESSDPGGYRADFLNLLRKVR